MQSKDEIIIVFTHVPTKACAESVAQALVQAKLAACVNISSAVTSVYRWQGQIEQAEEYGLTIKTTRHGYAALEQQLRAMHPYELPEIVALHVQAGLAEYLAWVAQATLEE